MKWNKMIKKKTIPKNAVICSTWTAAIEHDCREKRCVNREGNFKLKLKMTTAWDNLDKICCRIVPENVSKKIKKFDENQFADLKIRNYFESLLLFRSNRTFPSEPCILCVFFAFSNRFQRENPIHKTEMNNSLFST